MDTFFGIAENVLIFLLKIFGIERNPNIFWSLPFFISIAAIFATGVPAYLLLRSSLSRKIKWFGQLGIMTAIIALAVFLTNHTLDPFLQMLPLALYCSVISRNLAKNVEWSELKRADRVKKLLSAFVILAPLLHYVYTQYVFLTWKSPCPHFHGLSTNPIPQTFWEGVFGVPPLGKRDCVPEGNWDEYRYYIYMGERLHKRNPVTGQVPGSAE
ncbi:MAG: hypothetical protein ACAH80_08835 [Alphaproteobacteria bacterium]